MDILKSVRFRNSPREGKTTSRRIPPGLLALGVVVLLAACGAPAATEVAVAPTAGTKPTDIINAYMEAITAGDAEAALDLFTDDAVFEMTGGMVLEGNLRQWIDQDIWFFGEGGGECAEWLNVEETETTLECDERCSTENGVWDNHHLYVFENGKIKRWTVTMKQVE